jgi:hypothetical protein
MTAARDRPNTLSIRINAGSLYRTENIINYKTDKYDVS